MLTYYEHTEFSYKRVLDGLWVLKGRECANSNKSQYVRSSLFLIALRSFAQIDLDQDKFYDI